MDTIEGVIETYEMRTGNSASASAARQALAELKAESEERQRIYICACNVNTQLRTELDEARKVIAKENDAVMELLYMDELQLLANKKQFSFHYLRQTLEASAAWLASNPKDGEK